MSKATKKTKTEAVLKEASISHTRLGEALGRDRFYV